MEKRDLYDINKNFAGMTFNKGEQVPKGYYYLIVAVFIENNNNEFLIQRRVASKGGKWATTAGHPKSGENSIQGLCSEVLEEIGIDISGEDIKLVDTWINNDQIFDIYYLKKDIDLKDISIQQEEVAEVDFATKEEIKEMYLNNQFHENHYILFQKCMVKVEV